jgi:enterochelin esterase-like enzyme
MERSPLKSKMIFELEQEIQRGNNVGILETKDRMIDTNIKLRDVLIEKGYTVDFEYFNSGHDYLCWGETLANGLISLMGIK